ncbi:hypothetical protein BGZ47_000487 [Haplosporangium gracile]|nr:hypothetical protein BGZ47_000487 [Haplosporangium gracile]
MSTDNRINTNQTIADSHRHTVVSRDKRKDKGRNMGVDFDTQNPTIKLADTNVQKRKLSYILRSSSNPGIGRKRAANFTVEIPQCRVKHPRTTRTNASEQGGVQDISSTYSTPRPTLSAIGIPPAKHTLFPYQQTNAQANKTEAEEWFSKASWYDPDLDRVRYAHPKPTLILTEKHEQILEAAFQVHRDKLDALTDEDMEFFAAFTGVTFQAANEWFIRRRRENMVFDEGSPPLLLPPPTTRTRTRMKTTSTTPVLPRHLHTKKENCTATFSGSSAGANRIVATLVKPCTPLNELVEKVMDRIVAAFEQDAAADDAIINTETNEAAPEPTIYEVKSSDIIIEPIKPVEPSDTTATSTKAAESTNTAAEPTTVVEPSNVASKRIAKGVELSRVVAKSANVIEPINTVDNVPTTVDNVPTTVDNVPTTVDNPPAAVEHSTTNTKSIMEVETTSTTSTTTSTTTINTTTINTKAITKVGFASSVDKQAAKLESSDTTKLELSKLSTKSTVDTTPISSSPEKSKAFLMSALDTTGINKKCNSATYHMFDMKPLKRSVVTKIYGRKSSLPTLTSPISVTTPKSTTTTITVTKLPSSSQSSPLATTPKSTAPKTLSSPPSSSASTSPISVATSKSSTAPTTIATESTSSSSSSPLVATPNSITTKVLPSSSSSSSASASPLTEPSVTSSRLLSTTDQSGSSDHVITRKAVPYKHRVLQERQCIEEHDDQGSGASLYQEACKPCTEQQGKSICSFKEFRVFYVDSQDAGKDIASYRYGPDFSHDPSYDKALRFRRKGLDHEKACHIFAHTFPFGLSILERELLHVLSRTGLKLRKFDLELGAPNHNDYVRCSLDDRQYCEKCKSAIVAGYWMCCVCGEELCLDCFGAFCDTTMCTKGRQHQRKQFVACGKFHAMTLQKYIAALRDFEQALPQAAIEAASKSVLLPATVAVQKDSTKRGHYRLPVQYDASNLDLKTFRHYWQQGKVLQVKGVGKRLKRSWTPKYLVSEHGEAQVDVIRCQDAKTKVMNMAKYFLNYFDDHKNTDVWKMGDWPEEPFHKVLPELFEDLMQALPLPEYTNPNGVFNLAKYFPVHQVNAEISAKLYISQKQLEKHKDFSPMQLSAEMSDSIYICTYTQAVTGGAALWWDIYRAEDRPLIEAFLRTVMAENKNNNNKKKKQQEETDPFTYDSQYLSPRLKDRLYHETGVRATEVHQKDGEAVMIPAGCVRQARYLQKSIVVGLDFVSPERFAQTMEWSRALRRFNLERKGEGLDDVLQANKLAFFSTVAMLNLQSSLFE